MEWVSGNVFIREMHFERQGQEVRGHAHNFDHTTYVTRGGLRFETGGQVIEKYARDGANFVLIRAGVEHRITALEDDSMGHCIYAHRDPQGEIVQVYDGWTPAYV